MTTKLVSTGVEFPDATTQTTSGVPLTGGTMTGALTTTGFTSTGIDDNATSTAITIDASENVGIGVTDTADAQLVIRSTGVDGTFAPVISLQYSGNSNEHNSIGSSVAGASANSGINFKISNGAGSTGQTEKVRITRDGLLFNGDTAAANALDDYEEGTWTPNFSGGVTLAGQSAAVWGKYTKIGNVVNIFCNQIDWTSFTGTGNISISGLPFALAGARSAGVLRDASSGSFTVGNLQLGSETSGTAAQLYSFSTTNQTGVAVNAGHLGAAGILYGASLTYMTN